MYDASPDPYCYPGTKILKNLADLRRQSDLNTFELALTTQRFAEGLPRGRLSVTHYYAVHRHLFQDVYAWAGKPRTVRIAKGASSFCYPENIATEMRKLFTWLKQNDFLRSVEPPAFAKGAAYFLSELNRFIRFGTATVARSWPSWPCSPPRLAKSSMFRKSNVDRFWRP